MSNPKFELFHYWRSSSSWRVRAALSHKKIPYQKNHVGLLNGEIDLPEYLIKNPAGTVPTLKITGESNSAPVYLIESLAIIRYLDQIKPDPSLLPLDPIHQAKVWALAELINSGTQPIQNLPVMQFYSQTPADQKKWAQHWIKEGLSNYEELCTRTASKNSGYSYGDSLTIADLCLVPQCYNAIRYEVDMTTFPYLSEVYEHCLTLSCFQESHPDRFKPVD